MRFKVAAWVAAAAVGTLVVLTIIAALGSRTEPLRKLVVATLQDRLDSDVELKAFAVDFFPAVTVRGEGLTLAAPQPERSVDPALHPDQELHRPLRSVRPDAAAATLQARDARRTGHQHPARRAQEARAIRSRNSAKAKTTMKWTVRRAESLRSSSTSSLPTARSSASSRGARASCRRSSRSTR